MPAHRVVAWRRPATHDFAAALQGKGAAIPFRILLDFTRRGRLPRSSRLTVQSPMFGRFAYFDTALIEQVFQPAADTIAHRLGLDRLRLAGFCLDAASIAWILSQAGSLSAAVTHWQASTAFLRVLLLMLGLLALCSLRVALQRAGAAKGLNPLRVAMLPHRGVLLALLAWRLVTLGSFANAADLAAMLAALCALYLGACATPPRKPLSRNAREGRVRVHEAR